jgi:hypothetical protein
VAKLGFEGLLKLLATGGGGGGASRGECWHPPAYAHGTGRLSETWGETTVVGRTIQYRVSRDEIWIGTGTRTGVNASAF